MTTVRPFIQIFISKLGRTFLVWVIVPLVAFIVFNLALFLIVHLECWVLGEVTYSWGPYSELRQLVCRPDGTKTN